MRETSSLGGNPDAESPRSDGIDRRDLLLGAGAAEMVAAVGHASAQEKFDPPRRGLRRVRNESGTRRPDVCGVPRLRRLFHSRVSATGAAQKEGDTVASRADDAVRKSRVNLLPTLVTTRRATRVSTIAPFPDGLEPFEVRRGTHRTVPRKTRRPPRRAA
jgi:hypothetical protein